MVGVQDFLCGIVTLKIEARDPIWRLFGTADFCRNRWPKNTQHPGIQFVSGIFRDFPINGAQILVSGAQGKSRFQILGLKAANQQDLTDIINAYKIQPPTPADDPLGEEYNGWIMPVAVRVTSGHSSDIRIPLDPFMMMRRLDLRTALKLQGGYHVTSPSYLKSILQNGIMPGGTEGKRTMNYFGIFPPWDMRNRSTRTRSPVNDEMWMLVIFVPPHTSLPYL